MKIFLILCIGLMVAASAYVTQEKGNLQVPFMIYYYYFLGEGERGDEQWCSFVVVVDIYFPVTGHCQDANY